MVSMSLSVVDCYFFLKLLKADISKRLKFLFTIGSVPAAPRRFPMDFPLRFRPYCSVSGRDLGVNPAVSDKLREYTPPRAAMANLF
jgi:hypothetical protein